MVRNTFLAFAFVLSAAILLSAAEPVPPVGTRVADFTLTEPLTGKTWSLAEHTRDAQAVVVVFPSTSCPVSTGYIGRLTDLSQRYSAEKKVVWIAVASHPADDAELVAAHARETNYPFPILKDNNAELAGKLHIERVPSVLVLDSARMVRYAGRIDDQLSPGVKRVKASTSELVDALESVLSGEEVQVSHAPAAGCKLRHEKVATTAGPQVTYYKHVVPVLQAKCQECHRPGEAGPFSLTTYDQAKNWSAMVREVVADDLMPPWHADAPPGHFKNDRRLTPHEKQTLLAWIDQGCSAGDSHDAPPPKKFAEGWRLGRQPDEILRMNEENRVPAHGTLPYKYAEVGEPFEEDRWVTGVEVRPDQRAVVHHIIAFILPPSANLRDILGPKFGRYMLGAYVPGDEPLRAAPGYARKIEKGSRVVLEVHYTPNGRELVDRSSVGLCYSQEPPVNELFCLAVLNFKFRIPPETDNFEVKSQYKFEKGATLLSLAPHMHVRGKSFKYELVFDDGRRETILNVPKYDFNWQESYDFAQPVNVPAGTVLECTALFDNTSKNPSNPDPKRTIGFGNMTVDEMMIGFVVYHDTK